MQHSAMTSLTSWELTNVLCHMKNHDALSNPREFLQERCFWGDWCRKFWLWCSLWPCSATRAPFRGAWLGAVWGKKGCLCVDLFDLKNLPNQSWHPGSLTRPLCKAWHLLCNKSFHQLGVSDSAMTRQGDSVRPCSGMQTQTATFLQKSQRLALQLAA